MNAGYDVLKNRRSIRRFRSDDVPRELIEKVVEAGLYAPSAMGTQHTVYFCEQIQNEEYTIELRLSA